jgi:glycosyltransferase involved in cell wall biosynthesis
VRPLTISVAMATHNGDKFVREQLTSIAAQSLLPTELVVSDDRSTDATLDMVKEFKKEAPFEVTVLSNARRIGASANFLRTAELCSGDVIAFSDQDDVWDKNKLSIYEHEFSTTSANLVAHSGTVVDANLSPTGEVFPRFTTRRSSSPGSAPLFPAAWGFCLSFRRELLSLVPSESRPPGWLRDKQMGHDSWIYFLANALGGVTTLDDQLALYRQHANNASGGSIEARAARRPARLGPAQDKAVYMDTLVARCDLYADFLEAASVTDEVAQAFHRTARTYRRAATLLGRRARLYSPISSQLDRLGGFIGLSVTGAYASPTKGHLGKRAFLEDAAVSLRGHRSKR